MAYDDHENDPIFAVPRPYPTTVAGVTWILTGVIAFGCSPLCLVVAMDLPGSFSVLPIALIACSFVVALLAVRLILMGKRTLKGQNIHLARSSVGTMLLGACLVVGNVWLLLRDTPNKQVATIIEGVGVNLGVVLFLVSVLAILGGRQDQAWRDWKSDRL